MSWPAWLQLHLIRWEVWTTVTVCFASALTWLRSRPRLWPYAPWLLLLAWLACAGLFYLVSDWHHVFFVARRTWAHGTIAIVAIGLIPTLAVFLAELALHSRVQQPVMRTVLTAIVGLMAAFLFNAPVAKWIQVALRTWSGAA